MVQRQQDRKREKGLQARGQAGGLLVEVELGDAVDVEQRHADAHDQDETNHQGVVAKHQVRIGSKEVETRVEGLRAPSRMFDVVTDLFGDLQTLVVDPARVEVGKPKVADGDQPFEVDWNQNRLQEKCANRQPHQPAALFLLADDVEDQQEEQREREPHERTQEWGGRGFIHWNSPSCRRSRSLAWAATRSSLREPQSTLIRDEFGDTRRPIAHRRKSLKPETRFTPHGDIN